MALSAPENLLAKPKSIAQKEKIVCSTQIKEKSSMPPPAPVALRFPTSTPSSPNTAFSSPKTFTTLRASRNGSHGTLESQESPGRPKTRSQSRYHELGSPREQKQFDIIQQNSRLIPGLFAVDIDAVHKSIFSFLSDYDISSLCSVSRNWQKAHSLFLNN